MNENILTAEEAMLLFNLFTDEIIKGDIDNEYYLGKFREVTGAGKNSPFEFMFRGFIGGLYMASLDAEGFENEGVVCSETKEKQSKTKYKEVTPGQKEADYV